MGSLSRIGGRALALACTALIGGAAAAVAEPGAAHRIIIFDGTVQAVRESSGAPFLCSVNQVLLGRSHNGDQNGGTTYYCGLVLVDGQQVTVSAPVWSTAQQESNSSFAAPADRVLVGQDSASGTTRYATATMSAWGRTVQLASYRWSPDQRESSSYSKGGDYEVMVGRQHSGDDHGQTRYQYAKVVG
ncbi:hypothetical protein [Amycolatopsis panacis]|uniref:Uncharacterized protein n=1 Tax=Amycolatopsis panacis TaxID=2340917 RepID=A0A419HVY0_9PSEU|nr:hypothetical protein [Amycolatopsis panacis]RJQ81116.1 hypothetical protein D5S19_23995 [Amycolatopsis panacis]